jgi:hypothetical protein
VSRLDLPPILSEDWVEADRVAYRDPEVEALKRRAAAWRRAGEHIAAGDCERDLAGLLRYLQRWEAQRLACARWVREHPGERWPLFWPDSLRPT